MQTCYTILQKALLVNPDDKHHSLDPALAQTGEQLFRLLDATQDGYINFSKFVDWQRRLVHQSGVQSHDELTEIVQDVVKELQFGLTYSMAGTRSIDDDSTGTLDTELEYALDNLGESMRALWSPNKTRRLKRKLQDTTDGFQEPRAGLLPSTDFSNSWEKLPEGLSTVTLLKKFMAEEPVHARGVQRCDYFKLIIPSIGNDNLTQHWLALVFRRTTFKTGMVEEQEGYYELVQNGNESVWSRCQNMHAFEKSLETIIPAMQFFCLLKTEANISSQVSWSEVSRSITAAAELGIISADTQQTFKERARQLVDVAGLSEHVESLPNERFVGLLHMWKILVCSATIA